MSNLCNWTRQREGALLMFCGLAFVNIGDPMAGAAGARTISVPGDYYTIDAAVDAARSGDVVEIDGSQGPFEDDLEFQAYQHQVLTVRSRPKGPTAVILARPGKNYIAEIDNRANTVMRITFENLIFDGNGENPTYGIRIYTGSVEDKEPRTTLDLHGVAITDCSTGLQSGSTTGVHGCDGNWGAVNWGALDQHTVRLQITDSAITNCSKDGIRGYDVVGNIERCFIAYHGNQAVHTTAARSFAFRHNIVAWGHSSSVHFQLAGDVDIRNNIFTMAQLNQAKRPPQRGFGLVLGGSLDGGRTRIHNNLFVGNTGAGAKINPAQVVISADDCRGFPVVADVRNNIFVANGQRTGRESTDPDFSYSPGGIQGNHVTLGHNLFQSSRKPVTGLKLDPTNFVGVNPGFQDPVEPGEMPPAAADPLTAMARARVLAAGYALSASSPAIDAGDPRPILNDGGGDPQGTPRGDLGIYGGPGSDWTH